MKIDRVIFAWDGHPTYTGMWEAQCEIWPKLGVRPTLFIFDGVEVPPTPEGCDVRVIQPATDVLKLDPPARNWQATLPLIFAPQLFPGETVMTSGIDQVPLSRRFMDAVAEVPYDRFLVAFGGVRGYEEHAEAFGCPYYPSSHMVAPSSIWSELLADTPKEFSEFAKWAWDAGFPTMWGGGWGLDEATISQLLARHQAVKVHLFSREWFDEWDTHRIDAERYGNGSASCDQLLLEAGYYSESHLSHPPPPHQWDIVRRAAAALA